MADSLPPKVMVVDDEQHVLKVVGDMLADGGFQVLSCNSAKQALQLADQSKPDIIFLDILMPETNGYEFCRTLRQREKQNFTPVIFLTGLSTEQDKAQAFAAGASDFLSKPVTRDMLLKTAQKHIEAKAQWKALDKKNVPPESNPASPRRFQSFKEFLCEKSGMMNEKRNQLLKIKNF